MERHVDLLVSVIVMFSGALWILYTYYNPEIDPLVTVAIAYSYITTLFVEKKMILPQKISTIYSHRLFDLLSLLLYLPGAYMMYMIGYSYGATFEFAKIFSRVLCSAMLGIILAAIFHLINIYLVKKFYR